MMLRYLTKTEVVCEHAIRLRYCKELCLYLVISTFYDAIYGRELLSLVISLVLIAK